MLRRLRGRLWAWLTRYDGPLCPYCRRPIDDCSHDPLVHQDAP